MKKSTGIVRRIDELGRVVIPIELRRAMNLNEKDPVEIFTDGKQIIFEKYEPGCEFTGEMNNLIEYNGHKVSKAAIKEMARKAGLL